MLVSYLGGQLSWDGSRSWISFFFFSQLLSAVDHTSIYRIGGNISLGSIVSHEFFWLKKVWGMMMRLIMEKYIDEAFCCLRILGRICT